MVHVEASYNEGLSAGLFQQSAKGWQPVHFISRSLTDVEKRYSQTEKDALCVKWAKDWFGMYLQGAPRFTIVTAHKPLLPMFSKPSVKLPPRIEKWVMDMQDVDFEMKYEPGRDKLDPLDFLSRHPLPVIGNDDTEKVLKAAITTEHAVVLDRIREETSQDRVLRKLSQTIRKGNWESSKRDADLTPFYQVKEELYESQGMIFRMERIILAANLQQKIIKSANTLGHLGTTKTKQMLREKYWFPGMNHLISQTIGSCFDCQVATKSHRQEPIKPSVIPEEPWEHISIDFGGPYPDGHYNLVAIDQRTRYPVVEVHHRVTPNHLRANGQVERFMQTLNKTEQIAHLQGKSGPDRNMAVQDMLIAYRDTPHPATGISPYQAMMNRPVRTKLDYTVPRKERSSRDKMMDEKDRQYKEKMADEGGSSKEHNFVVGDHVLLRQRKRNKWSTPYEPVFYTVIKNSGSAITARRITDGREVQRDASQFKLANVLMYQENVDESGQSEDWRETLLMGAGDMKDQPIYQKDVEQENLLELPEQETTAEPVQENPTKQSGSGSSQEGGTTAVNRQEVDMPSPAVQDTSVPSSSSTRPSRPKRTRRRPAYLNDFIT